MIQTDNDGVQIFTFTTLPETGITHGVLGRTGGHSIFPNVSLNLSREVGDDVLAVTANRHTAYGQFGRTFDTLVHAGLVHGNNVVRVTGDNHGKKVLDADGLITNEPGVGLTMNFADCTPVFLYDPTNHAIGLGHSGWRGAIADLPGEMVRQMVAEFGSDPKELIGALGPCISVAQYVVDEPVIEAVSTRFPAWVDRLLVYGTDDDGERVGNPKFNLALANHICLHEAGMELDSVELPGLCTAAKKDIFFSHRAEDGNTGRFGAVFTLD